MCDLHICLTLLSVWFIFSVIHSLMLKTQAASSAYNNNFLLHTWTFRIHIVNNILIWKHLQWVRLTKTPVFIKIHSVGIVSDVCGLSLKIILFAVYLWHCGRVFILLNFFKIYIFAVFQTRHYWEGCECRGFQESATPQVQLLKLMLLLICGCCYWCCCCWYVDVAAVVVVVFIVVVDVVNLFVFF